MEIRSPLDGTVLATLPEHGAEEVGAAVERVRAAQEEWRGTPPRERARAMSRLAAVLARRGDEIAHRVRAETGKPLPEALTEVVVAAELLRFYGRKGARHLAPRTVWDALLFGKSARVEREPYGVVGGITPWNYPFILAMDVVTPALMAGNGVVLKPSEFTPWTALLIPELVGEAGIPPHLVEVVTGRGDTGAALVGGGIDRLVFTGSTATGRRVMAAAAEHLVPVTLELGGKDPAVVLADADLDRAAAGVAYGAFFNAGQTCISVERAYVERTALDAFLTRVVNIAESLRPGTDGSADIGPMVTEQQLEIVKRHVEDARSRGARILTGGTPAADNPRIFLPTVLADVDASMLVMTEESFGPLLPVMAVEDADDAVRRANALGYGLFASVWTGDANRGRRVARRLRAGGVSINDVLTHYAVGGLPMGGRGGSGFGRRRGLEGLDELSRPRTILRDRVGLKRDPWWFPYSARSLSLARAMLQWTGRRGPGRILGALRVLSPGRRGGGK